MIQNAPQSFMRRNCLMILKIAVFILFCSLSSTQSQAQKGELIFCDSVTASGQAIGEMQSLIMDPGGYTVKLYYKSSTGQLNTRKVKITFEKLVKSAFQKFDEISFFCEPKQSGIVNDFHVTKSGDYRIRYYDYDNQLMADEILSVSDAMQESDSQHETNVVALAADSVHSTQILFSDGLSGDNTTQNTEFSYRATRGKLYLHIEPFDATSPSRIVDIWKKEGEEYSRFVTSTTVKFSPENSQGVAAVNFPEPAAYKVTLYSTENILITTSFVELK